MASLMIFWGSKNDISPEEHHKRDHFVHVSVTGPFVKKMRVFKNLVAGVSHCPITIYAPMMGGS